MFGRYLPSKKIFHKRLRAVLDITFVCLIVAGPRVFFYDAYKSSFLIKTSEGDNSYTMADGNHKNLIIQRIPDKLVECINCNFSIKNPSTNLCPNCGSDIYLKSEYISCESCGSEYDNNAHSCPYCGAIFFALIL